MSETLAQEMPMDLTGPILALTSQLIEAIRHETMALREMRILDIEPLQKEKARLVDLYRDTLDRLRSGRARVAAEPEPQAELRQMTAELADAAAENEKFLRASRVATERVMKIVVDAVRSHRGAPNGYTANARTRAHSSLGVSGITMDHRL